MEFKQLNTNILMSKIEIFFEEITYSSKFTFLCGPSTTLLGDRITKDLTRSYVNISPKGQKKVHGVFTRIPQRTTGMRQADHGHRDTGKN